MKSFRRKPKQNNVQYVPKQKAVVNQVAQKVIAQMKPKQNKMKSKKITPAGQFLRKAGGIAGGFLGNASLGRSLGAGISRIFGQGDYQVQSNSLVKGGPPAFAALNTGTRIAHREYIADVISSVGFANTTYDINPMNNATFPWLSKLAANYEEYSVKGIVFYFNTSCGNAISSTNNALGTVGLVTVYDPSDPPLASKRECEDYSGCVAGVPAQSLLHPIECKPRSNVLDRLYVQVNALSNPEDLKFYSHGKLNVFTQGMQQAGVVLGELWVSYDIEFYNPKILPIGTVNQAASKGYVITTTQAAGFLLGTSDQTFSGNLGLTYTGSTGIFTLPQGTSPGYYLVNVMMSSTTGTFLFQVNNLSSNITNPGTMQGNSVGSTSTPNAATSNPWHGVTLYLYKSDANTAFFGVNYATNVPTGTVGADIIVTKIPAQAITGVAGPFGLFKPEIEEDAKFNKLVKQLARIGIKPLVHELEDSDTDIVVSTPMKRRLI